MLTDYQINLMRLGMQSIVDREFGNTEPYQGVVTSSRRSSGHGFLGYGPSGSEHLWGNEDYDDAMVGPDCFY